MITSLILLSFVASAGGDMPVPEGTVVHRPNTIDERDAFSTLPDIALLNAPPEKSLLKLGKQVAAAGTNVAAGKKLYLMAAGPTLDGPDEVQVHSLSKEQGKLVLQVHHTSARLTDANLRRNVVWRPLVQVPVELAPGDWDVSVEWTPYARLGDGTPLEKPTICTGQFEVMPPAPSP